MLEILVISVFAASLLTCILLGYSILFALLLGYVLFITYGLLTQHTIGQMLRMSAKGIQTVKNILLIFLLIGALTAVWRASGTIPVIIYYSSKLIIPSMFILISFLLCCLISVLTGTAFGTAATIGVICMTTANAMGVNPVYMGGAILSGVYFGDRCSPMSTSALLVCELTKTDIFRNIRLMIRTSIVPFAASCIIYLLLGVTLKSTVVPSDIQALFAQYFNLHWLAIMPALLIIVLSLLKINVKIAMSISILLGSIICLVIQHMAIGDLWRLMISGYQAFDPRLAVMMDGGGILSMLKVAAIVCLSSSYAGIFDGTGLLNGLKKRIVCLSQRISSFGSAMCTSTIAGMVSCNQTLTIMLTHQLCREAVAKDEEMAIILENTAVIIAPLIPWSIAGAVPIAAVSAPTSCLLAACYLYLIPIWNLIETCLRKHSHYRRPFHVGK